MHISHNAPYLLPRPRPNFVYALFSISRKTAAIPRRNEKQRLCKIGGEKIRCIMGDVQVAYGKFVLRFYSVESS